MKKESSRHVRRKRVPLLERDDGAGCEVPFGAVGGSAKRVVVRTLAAHGFSKKVTNQGGTAKTCLRPCYDGGDGDIFFREPATDVFIHSFLGGSFSL